MLEKLMVMDYKKIVKSRKLRFLILNCCSWVPDSIMLRVQYYIKMGRRLSLKHPRRFSEKLQWYKLYYRNPLMFTCVDKYDVRGYISSKEYSDLLNECYGVYDSARDIPFKELPNRFVIKTTDGGGGQNVFICKDKSNLDIEKLIEKLDGWKNKIRVHPGREWAYTGIKGSRFIVEKYIESALEKGGLVDYKFHCFNGNVKYLYVIADRDMGDKCGLGIYTIDFERIDTIRADEKPLSRNIEKPYNFEEMVKIAKNLSSDFPHVRVDLYNVEGKIIFGEFTFYDASGYMRFSPDSFDFELGEEFVLPVPYNEIDKNGKNIYRPQ